MLGECHHVEIQQFVRLRHCHYLTIFTFHGPRLPMLSAVRFIRISALERKETSSTPLLDRGWIHGRTRTIDELQRSAREKERVLAVLCAVFCEILEPHYFVEDHAEVSQQRAMQDRYRAGLRMIRLLARDRIGANRRDLHVVEPFDEFFAVFETWLVILPIGEERLRPFVVIAGEPARMKHENVVLLDRRTLLFRRAEQI